MYTKEECIQLQTFLNRVDLKGAEVPAMANLMTKLGQHAAMLDQQAMARQQAAEKEAVRKAAESNPKEGAK